MKKTIQLTLACGLTVLLAACGGDKTVQGSGQVTSQPRELTSFEKVNISGNFNVILTRGWPQKLSVTTDNNLQSYVLTTVKDGELDIQTKTGFSLKPSKPITITVSTKKLEEVDAKGNSNVGISGLSTDKFNFKAQGATQASLAGRVDKADLEVGGAAKVDAQKLFAKDVDLDVKGAVHMSVYATKKLDVKIKGAAQVIYFGQPPVVNQAVYGGGALVAGKQST